jgi:hypothetical protein
MELDKCLYLCSQRTYFSVTGLKAIDDVTTADEQGSDGNFSHLQQS